MSWVECSECKKDIRKKKELVIIELHNGAGDEWLESLHKKCKKKFMSCVGKG